MQSWGLSLAWSWQPVALALIVAATALYGAGWRHLRQSRPELANGRRLAAFLVAMLLLLLATLSPIYALSTQFLAARTLQKIFVAMLAAPLIWLACPFHVMAWGLPRSLRRRMSRMVLRPSSVRTALFYATQPAVALLIFVSAFLLWHDPQVANWSLPREGAHRLTLWLLFWAALFFWWHVIGTAPRLHRRLPGWLIAAMLVLVEVPNMVSGITIAFMGRPLYAYYEAAQATLLNPLISPLEDQMLSGGMIWVTGSLVYLTSLIIVLHHSFVREGDVPPVGGFSHDFANRALAPGLEHRTAQHPWDQTDWD